MSGASRGDVETAALATGNLRAGDEVPLPQPLKERDAQLYRAIFHLQSEGRFSLADKSIAKLGNELLLGHVLAQRYLGQDGYHAKYVELSEWLARYADLPEAPALYRLALTRAPRGARHLRHPEGNAFAAAPASDGGSGAPRESHRSDWARGLAAWHARHYAEAARFFERVTASEAVDRWGRAAGAYWAARSYLRNRQPDKVAHWLDVAGEYPYTFYGILARRLAGRDFDYDWSIPVLTRADAALVAATPAGLRALALIQIGQDMRAEQELRRLNPAQPGMAHALLAVSERADMPALALQLAEQLAGTEGQRYDAALYPVPSWSPRGGFKVDQALVLALIRLESKFLVGAESSAGARGLMQLMPETARFVADNRHYRGAAQLFEPETNLTLGQKYLTHLTTVDGVGDNLLLMVAAYNAGPGTLAHWEQESRHDDDPLLFLETIPNLETRHFVERVLANYWIYGDQLGEPATSLDELVEGRWPTYKSPDAYLVPVASHDRH
ncbi:MAG TPA: lytic transglycosylase domain-containing protein [Alphaproteobacteria bacterium]|nr:lytic transglycosylase domain-containing protein [Alphaproteobacteria bacterium]